MFTVDWKLHLVTPKSPDYQEKQVTSLKIGKGNWFQKTLRRSYIVIKLFFLQGCKDSSPNVNQ